MDLNRPNRLPEGVGKKIVDALKKDAIDINAIPEEQFEQGENYTDEDIFGSVNPDYSQDDDFEPQQSESYERTFEEETDFEAQKPQAFSPAFNVPPSSTAPSKKADSTLNEIEMPANIDILKRLISQLPPGVTRQTGAQIIRQTMEAMGISMKSVLSEAQYIQEELGSSVQDCLNTVEEYKNNIRMLERKVQNYKKQANQLGELINLFIMTDKKLR